MRSVKFHSCGGATIFHASRNLYQSFNWRSVGFRFTGATTGVSKSQFANPNGKLYDNYYHIVVIIIVTQSKIFAHKISYLPTLLFDHVLTIITTLLPHCGKNVVIITTLW